MSPYTKPHATPQQWVQHLRERGLVIPKPAVAAKKLELIGYERLRVYFNSRRQSALPGRPFQPGIHYRDVLRIYECDALLRCICFEFVGEFEILFRNTISETLSKHFGSHPQFNPAAFKSRQEHIDRLHDLTGIFARSKDQRAHHYRDKYGSPSLPPIWTMKEFLTFGNAVTLFKSLAGPIRTEIANSFGIPSDDVFSSWLVCLQDLRNAAAHHDRLFNRRFQKTPAKLKRKPIPTAPDNTLCAILECLDYLREARGQNASCKAAVRRTILRFPQIALTEAGFPAP